MFKNTSQIPNSSIQSYSVKAAATSTNPSTWLNLGEILNQPGHQEFPMKELQRLIRESIADHDDVIPEFVENGAAIPNADLRSLSTHSSHQLSQSTTELLVKLHRQRDWVDQCAYRVLYACPEAADKLTTPGTCIADLGVQSANIHLPHAQNWQLDHPRKADQKFILVIAHDVAKKNISTRFLMDHVAILPGTVLEVVECEKREDATYVLLKSAQSQDQNPIYSPFDGTAYENFSQAKDHLKSFQTKE